MVTVQLSKLSKLSKLITVMVTVQLSKLSKLITVMVTVQLSKLSKLITVMVTVHQSNLSMITAIEAHHVQVTQQQQLSNLDGPLGVLQWMNLYSETLTCHSKDSIILLTHLTMVILMVALPTKLSTIRAMDMDMTTELITIILTLMGHRMLVLT